jgi:hypothetical protein
MLTLACILLRLRVGADVPNRPRLPCSLAGVGSAPSSPKMSALPPRRPRLGATPGDWFAFGQQVPDRAARSGKLRRAVAMTCLNPVRPGTWPGTGLSTMSAANRASGAPKSPALTASMMRRGGLVLLRGHPRPPLNAWISRRNEGTASRSRCVNPLNPRLPKTTPEKHARRGLPPISIVDSLKSKCKKQSATCAARKVGKST